MERAEQAVFEQLDQRLRTEHADEEIQRVENGDENWKTIMKFRGTGIGMADAGRRGAVDNTDGVVEECLRALERVRASGVHIYTLQREPALGTLRKVAKRRLREIAERVRALQIPAQVF
jgi:hypothetical protein